MPNTSTTATVANLFFEDTHELLVNLYGRWQDEKEYEDITSYAKPIFPAAMEHGVRILKMTKRPFGLQFVTPNGNTYKMWVTATSCSYKRIA